jgi:UPF0716 protein FxsA
MWPLLFVALLAVPLAELWVILESAEQIGLGSTLGLLLVISIAGASLLRRQGMAAWNRLQTTVERGEVPSRELVDGALILLGGALLLTPGFLTDAIGLVLLIPPTRSVVKGLTRRLLARWVGRRFEVSVSRGRAYPGEVTNARRRGESSPLPPRGGEDGSPGRR